MARGTTVPLALPSSVSDEESSALSAQSLLLILMFGASILLLALAAIPPAWSVRFASTARLVHTRGWMAMAGGFILLEIGVFALLLAQ